MDKLRRIVSFCLTLAIILGMVVIPSPVNAKISSNDIKEVSYKLVEENGIPYREYNLADLVDINYDAGSRKEIDNRNSIGTMAVGDFIPDADNYQVQVNWTAWSMSPDKLGTDVYFTIYDPVSRKTIAKTDTVTGTGLYKFKETADWGTSGVGARENWVVRWPNEVRFDIRLKTGNGSATAPAVFQANITQRAMTLYRAEYYTNSSKPKLTVYRRNVEDEVDEVDINKENIGENQYYSFIKKPVRVYYEGKTIDIIKQGAENGNSYSVNDLNASQLVQIYAKVPGATNYDRGGEFEDNGKKYHYLVTGDYEHPHIVTVRQDLTVKFDANGGTWKTAAPADQTIGHSMKLADKWAGLGPIDVPASTRLTPPAAEAGEPEKEFKGWCIDANGNGTIFTDAAGYTEEIKEDTTFYAIYKEKAQGKIKVEYQDMNGNTIDDKYKLNGKDYPTELPGNNGEEIKAEHLNGAPEFLGYEYKSNATNPVPNLGEKAGYTEDGKYTLIYKYNKLDSVIPEKDPNGGNDNKKPTGYVTVTFKAGDNGKINNDTKDIKYFVNPKDDIKFGNAAIAEPTITANDNYDAADTKWNPDFVAKKVETITADAEFTAQYVKQKGTVTYEYKYENNTTITDPSKTDIPAAPTDATQYDVGTTVAAETNVADDKKVTGKTVPVEKNGVKIGQWTFGGWNPASLTIKKNSQTDKNEFTGTWTFTEAGKQQVTYEFASGTNGETLPEEVKSKLTKQAESKYVNDTVNAPTDTYSPVVISTGKKQGTWTFDGWYAGTTDANNKGKALKVTEAGPNKFIGVWNFAEKGKMNVTFEFAFYNSKGNKQIPNNAIGQFKPTLPPAQNNKYVGSDIDLPKFEGDKDNVKVNKGDLQGTWKFDGWYRGDTKLTPADAKVSENDAENKLVGKWILTETATKEVTREFVIDPTIMGANKDVPAGHVLPQGVTKQKPNDTKNYIGSTQTPGKDNFNAVEEKIGEKIGNWTFVKWNKTELTVVENPGPNDNKFTGTWTWKQAQSEKPTVDKPKAEDKVIKGKGKKGSTIVVTTPDGKTHKTTVGDNGDWSVTVPPVKENDKIKVTQEEKGKKPSDPVDVTVERKIKYFGHFYEPSPDYLNKNVPAKKEEKVQEKYLEAYRWYVKGNDMGMFMPKKGITRAEVAQMFARALEYDKAMVHTNITPYTDVDANAWYYEAVQKTSAAGIFKGSDKGTFMPTREITKAELIATIARFQHLNTKAGNTMNLQMNHWATSEVEAAYQEGWLDIYTNGTVQFRADEVITRAEVVTILNRAFGRMADAKYIDDNAHTMTNFTDVTKDMWSYYEIMTAANTYLVDKMWVNHATKDNGPETLKEMIEWVKPLIDNKDVREVVEQVRFQR